MIKELLEFEILEIDAASEYWKEYLPNLGQDWQISSFSIFRITSVAQQWIISQISEFIFPVVTKVDQFFIFSISLNFFPWNFLGFKIFHFFEFIFHVFQTLIFFFVREVDMNPSSYIEAVFEEPAGNIGIPRGLLEFPCDVV